MSEQVTKTSEASKPEAIDMSKYVPKDQVESLQADLEKAKLDLLSPEYIEFLEAKKLGKDKVLTSKVSALLGELKPEEIESLPKVRLLQLAVERAKEELTPAIRKEFNDQLTALSNYVGNLGAYIEVQDIRNRHKDFDEYADDISKLFEKATKELTYEEAYLMAKGARQTKEPEGEKKEEKPKPKGSEKPGGTTPPANLTEKKFKSDYDAGLDAWEQVKTKHGITGDTI